MCCVVTVNTVELKPPYFSARAKVGLAPAGLAGRLSGGSEFSSRLQLLSLRLDPISRLPPLRTDSRPVRSKLSEVLYNV